RHLNFDDYDGLDVAGKIVVLIRRAPRYEGEDAALLKDDDLELATFANKIVNADQHKAAGVLIVNDQGSARGRDDLVPFEQLARESAPAKIPVMHVRRELADRIIRSCTQTDLATLEEDIERDLKPRSLPLPGWKATVEVTLKRRMLDVKNVIGVLPGAG